MSRTVLALAALLLAAPAVAATQREVEESLTCQCSPTLRGFNWLAWVTPFAAILMGGLGVTLVIRRWVRAPGPPPAAPPPAADELRQRLARELEDMDREP